MGKLYLYFTFFTETSFHKHLSNIENCVKLWRSATVPGFASKYAVVLNFSADVAVIARNGWTSHFCSEYLDESLVVFHGKELDSY